MDNFRYLEHLSVRVPHCIMQCPNDFHQNSLSNGFSHLKSCSYPDGLTTTRDIKKMRESPSLVVLNVGIMDFDAYNLILLSCPNLYFLRFSQWPWHDISFPIKSHIHLKRMIIKITFNDFLHYNQLNDYFACVPNLKQLTIHHYLDKLIMKEKSFQKCDWFASMIAYYLPVLSRFHLYLHRPSNYRTKEVDLKIEENFKRMHNNHHQFRIIIKY